MSTLQDRRYEPKPPVIYWVWSPSAGCLSQRALPSVMTAA